MSQIQLSALDSNESKDLVGKKIELESTSSSTAKVTPIILCQTDSFRLRFLPQIVNNSKNPEQSVSGKLVYEKKKKNALFFPSEEVEEDKLSRQSVKTGEWMEISLKTEETFNLFQGLSEIFNISSTLEYIPYGKTEYAKVDARYRNYLSMFQKDPETVKKILDLLTSSESLGSLKMSLAKLENNNLSNLSETINVEQLQRAEKIISKNLDNKVEEFWQSEVFSKHQWLLGQIFSSPCTIYQEKAYVGGKSVSNKGGNICDFLYKNKLTKNVTLIEIKTPSTKIAGADYRNTCSFSNDVTGAINQVLLYKDSLIKDYYQLCHGEDIEVFNPKCAVVIGKITDLDDKQKAAFENFRNSFPGVIIITFDEILEKIRGLISLLTKNDSDVLEEVSDDKLPF